MSFGVAVEGLDDAVGIQIPNTNPWYRLDGKMVVVIGDPVTGHGPGEHGGPTMKEGESWYKVGGIEVSREGHAATCNDTTSGRSWYRLAPAAGGGI